MNGVINMRVSLDLLRLLAREAHCTVEIGEIDSEGFTEPLFTKHSECDVTRRLDEMFGDTQQPEQGAIDRRLREYVQEPPPLPPSPKPPPLPPGPPS